MAVALMLALAGAAWATSGTVAPIGTGSYLVTVTNTSSEEIVGFVVVPGGEPAVTNIVPSPACEYSNSPNPGSITCEIAIAPGASAQMCYTGHALGEVIGGYQMLILGGPQIYGTITPGPAVASCPASASTEGSSGSTAPGAGAPGTSTPGAGSPGAGSTPGSSNTPGTKPLAKPWSHVHCKSVYKAWEKKHGHATAKEKKAEQTKLHKLDRCPLAILK